MNKYLIQDILDNINEENINSKILGIYKFINTDISDIITDIYNSKDTDNKSNISQINEFVNTLELKMDNQSTPLISNINYLKCNDILLLTDLCYCKYLLHFYKEEAKKIPIYRLPISIYKYNMFRKQRHDIDTYFKDIIEDKLFHEIAISPQTIKIRLNMTDIDFTDINKKLKKLIEITLKSL